jgi:hypothetical protein
MNYDLKAPCSNCPFRKEGGIRLRSARVKELIRTTQNPGAEFACHKTTKSDDEGERRTTAKSQHCAGALVYADKQGTSSQMMRIAERFGGFDWTQLEGHAEVFDSSRDFLATAIDRSSQSAENEIGAVCSVAWDNDCETHNDEDAPIVECWACGDDVCLSCSEPRIYKRTKEKVVVCKKCLDFRGDEFAINLSPNKIVRARK